MTLLPHKGSRLLEGVYVPLITPFAADGSVALDAVERLCHDYLDSGSAGIVALGTTGESSALDATEQRAVIDACAAVCAEHDKQLVVGAGTNSTAKTLAAVEALAGTPALAATLIVVPYYVRPSEAGVIAQRKMNPTPAAPGTGGGVNWAPVIDARILPEPPWDPKGSPLGADVPLLVGTGLNEFANSIQGGDPSLPDADHRRVLTL